jgi:hypothetical protein
MKIKQLPAVEFLRECFEVVGASLVWKVRPRHHFNSHRAWAMWNGKWPGKVAGRTMIFGGYRQVGICGARYLEHRVIAKMAGIEVDTLTIDHKDGNGGNNDLRNLRPATQAQNSANTTGWAKKSLRVGVFFVKRTGKFTASIRVNGKQKHLGTYADVEDAIAARESAEREHHGEFAGSARSVTLNDPQYVGEPA